MIEVKLRKKASFGSRSFLNTLGQGQQRLKVTAVSGNPKSKTAKNDARSNER